MIAPQVMLIADAVMVRARSDAAKAATLPTSSSVAPAPEQRRCHQRLDERVPTLEVGGEGVDHAAREQRDDADAWRPSSLASCLRNASTAVSEIWNPPML